MLRNSKISNNSRSFQSRTFKNNRVIASNISVILKPERSFYDNLFKRCFFHRLTNILSNERTHGHHANFVFFRFSRPQNVNPLKTGSRKFARSPKFPIHCTMGK